MHDHYDELQRALEQTVWYVAQARKIVARQLAVIERLRAAGLSLVAAEETLAVFNRTVQALEDQERQLKQEIEQLGEVGGGGVGGDIADGKARE